MKRLSGLQMKNKLKTNFILILMMFFSIAFFSGCDDDEGEPAAVFETGTMTDVDGNSYRTIKIGSQWWMAENLRVKKFRNGSPVMNAQNETDWLVDTASYCLYFNDSTAPGFLYNWHAVNNSNQLAPDGWHIPTDAEWKQLEIAIGMSSADADKLAWRGTNEGEKLKIQAPQGWTRYGDVWGNNESGFTALAGSCRLFNGTFGSPGLFATGFWWTASKYSYDDAWYRYLDYKSKQVFRSHESVKYGFSVRCVKD